MKDEKIFKNFGSIAKFEVLDSSQMNSLEAGAACESGCKKACLDGGQNYSRRVGVCTETEYVNETKEEEMYL